MEIDLGNAHVLVSDDLLLRRAVTLHLSRGLTAAFRG